MSMKKWMPKFQKPRESERRRNKNPVKIYDKGTFWGKFPLNPQKRFMFLQRRCKKGKF